MSRPNDYVPMSPASGLSTSKTYNSNGTITVNYSSVVANTPYSSSRIYTGQTTPGYHALVKSRKRRGLPMLPHSVSKLVSVDMKPYVYRLVYQNYLDVWVNHPSPPGGGYWKTNYGGYVTVEECYSFWCKFPYLPNPVHDSGVYQKAVAKFQNRVKGSSANLAQAFAERKQTAKLLSDTVWRVARAARALKRGRLGDVYQELGMSKGLSARAEKRIANTPPSRRLASHWLEVQYGWRPLLHDVHDAAELLSAHITTDRWSEVISVKAEGASRPYDWTKTDFVIGSNGKRVQYTVGQEDLHTRTRLKAHIRLDSQARQVLGQTGISNPALLAWELLPWSFVVDWFLPVGNYLESLTAYDGWELVDGTYSNFTKSTMFRTACLSWSSGSSIPGSGSFTDVTSSGEIRAEAWKYDRGNLPGFPTLSWPSFKPWESSLSKEHMANGLALLRQVFGR